MLLFSGQSGRLVQLDMRGWRKILARWRHAPFYAGLASAAVVLPALIITVPHYAVAGTAVAFFLVYLALTALRLPFLNADFLREHVTDTDEPAAIIFLVTLVAIAVSLAELFLLLNQREEWSVVHLALAFLSVTSGWLTIHTMAALHYAHLYWQPRIDGGTRGLDFPKTEAPGAYDFLYFAFVIGMTAQTSDVNVTTTQMRKTNIGHAIVSFFFNTVLVAAAVNAAVALAS